MNDNPTKLIIEFERALHEGQRVEVRWTAGSFGHYTAPGKVVKINRTCVRVAIENSIPSRYEEGVISYGAGFKIVVPLFSAFSRNSKWAQFNRVAPLEVGES